MKHLYRPVNDLNHQFSLEHDSTILFATRRLVLERLLEFQHYD